MAEHGTEHDAEFAPPGRRLPEATRDAALLRLREGMAESPRRVPAAAAVVGALALVGAGLAGALVGELRTDLGTAGSSEPPSPVQELLMPDSNQRYRVETGPSSEEPVCRPEGDGIPPVEGWTRLVTGQHLGVVVTVYDTPAGVLFCERTPKSTSWTGPVADPGSLAVAFTTANGTIAGFTGADERPFGLFDGQGSAYPARAGRIFLAPAEFRPGSGLVAQYEVRDSAEVQVEEPLTPPAVAERRLLADAGAGTPWTCRNGRAPLVDPEFWTAGPDVPVRVGESVQIARMGELLAVCSPDDAPSAHEPLLEEGNLSPGRVRGGGVIGVTVFHSFTSELNPESGLVQTESTSRALVGLVLDGRVTSVELVTPGAPPVAAVVSGGSFVLVSELLAVDDRGAASAELVTRDASGREVGRVVAPV
ncbi:hypothetical protein [Actinosynnema mirum]|uniref:Uncharacterized protein n=1 Tax=Actinosynnema mirum (strain ATCC 29888 / DSM 43827 / JCM 3225 / NBRC 14064 / NCIMB 13271 / NRRL B-12336 / IMRU 3971 / 101) TaxID=446462 RepID=C6WMI6_ACTMD|nr:hypothetical protein [Actinosynnema mirum]ACU36515.1 hypothetical protein Amir_2578 [Actinosynnema mirum DSM 43827]